MRKLKTIFLSINRTHLIIWVFIVGLVIIRYFLTRPNYIEGSHIRILANMYSEPYVSDGNQKFTLAGLFISLPQYPEIHYGDFVSIEGQVKESRLFKPKLIEVQETRNIFISLRRRIVSVYQRSLPEPYGSLIAGIVIGAKTSLPNDLLVNLRNTGTSHIVVASGMNVTLAANFILNILLRFIRRGRAIFITIIGLWLYTFILGTDAPVLRASIMVTVALIGQGTGMISKTFRALVIAFLFLLFINPDWITDVGFALSFATTASLILFQAKVGSYFKFLPEIIREDFVTSLTAQIGSLPIILVAFGRVNILSPVINTLILWTVPLIMLLGGLGGVLGLFFEPLGRLFIILCYPLTFWFVSVINLFS